jgi:antitoxin (DNA-binding transcriptional repressor) of toxin-antitoxin stability system
MATLSVAVSVGSRPLWLPVRTRFHSQVIEAVPAGECVEITHYQRQGLLSAPREERRRYPVYDEESIYEYVDQLRRGPERIEHDPSAVAIANVINKRRK